MAAFASPAAAGPSPDSTAQAQLQRQVDRQLRTAPGGKQTAPNEVSYDGGRFVVTFAQPATGARVNALAAAGPDCPGGWFCFYDGTGYGYPRGRLSSCGWQDLGKYGWSDRVESTHNNTGSAVQYLEHSDGGDPGNGHSRDFVLWTDGGYSGRDRALYQNWADHVVRVC